LSRATITSQRSRKLRLRKKLKKSVLEDGELRTKNAKSYTIDSDLSIIEVADEWAAQGDIARSYFADVMTESENYISLIVPFRSV